LQNRAECGSVIIVYMKTYPLIAIFLFTLVNPVAAQLNSNQIPNDSLNILAQIKEGDKALAKNDTAAAIRIYTAARAQARKLGMIYLDAKASLRIGDFYYSNEVYHRAFGNYTQAKNLFINGESDETVAEVTIALARTQYHRGNYRLAVNNFVEALQMAKKLQNKNYEAEALENLGLLYNSFQGFNEGTAYYIKARKVKESLNDFKGATRIAQILAETYYRKRLFDSALYFSIVARNGAEKTGMLTEAYMADINSAMSLIRLKKWNEAQAIMQQLSSHIYNNQDENRRLRYEICWGNYYLSKGDSATATTYYNKAKKLAGENSFPEMYALIYRNIAESHYECNQIKEAYENFTKYNNYITQLYSGRNLANLGSLENIMNATTSKEEARLLSMENGLKKSQLESELLKRLSLERENELSDSLLAKEMNLSEALQRENTFRRNELMKETVLKSALDRENKAAIEQLKKEKLIKLGLIAGSLLLLLSGVVILMQYRKQKNKNKLIQKQSDDLQVLMKEIHHRVKNNLQVVSSLLDLQSHTITDSQASAAVKEGKNRVQSMALIHQNLYSEGNIKGIMVKEYIHNLVQSLCDSYNITSDKVKVNANIDDLNLDVDTMIPLGLVLNELVSNSFKYAFKENHPGILNILLQEKDEKLHLKVSDNGAGFPADMDVKSTKSFGLKMIRAFAQKLKATLDIYNSNGAVVEMQISKFKAA
jgi:two-component sensor histidine kinase